MTTKALQIRDAVYTLLTASTCGGVPSTRIHKDIAFALSGEAADLPAIVVEMGNEQQQQSTIYQMEHQLALTVTVLSAATKGVGAQDAATAADAPIAEAHRRIMADRTLGGKAFDVQDTSLTRDRDELQSAVMLTRISYDVKYLTSTTSLEA